MPPESGLNTLLDVAGGQPRDLNGCCAKRFYGSIKEVDFERAYILVAAKNVRQRGDHIGTVLTTQLLANAGKVLAQIRFRIQVRASRNTHVRSAKVLARVFLENLTDSPPLQRLEY